MNAVTTERRDAAETTRRERYDPSAFEQKWRDAWAAAQLYRLDPTPDPGAPKWYAVTMYPYPSGDLHIGHWYAMAPSDAAARYRKMRGYTVFFPMGFDAFGLPAENAAIKRGIHPFTWTMSNIENMRRQMRSMGTMFDWEQEVVTCLPEYYRWNQWFFLQFLKAGLAYRAKAAVWWCPSCQTVLANEQVIDGRCERCESIVSRREMEQWFFRITKYADELLRYDGIEWPERVKTMQRNWIGRSDGARVTFRTEQGDAIEVFTTRPDTLWGATFMVLAPEHPLVEKLTTDAHRAEVSAYQEQARRQSEIERQSTEKEKTGVFTGGYAINPVNNERIPIWIADYVLMTYGTGAIMAVPAHDERDWAFAKRYGLEIVPVIEPSGGRLYDEAGELIFHDEYGPMINSGELSGTPGDVAVRRTIEWLEARGIGHGEVNYRLRDWLVSRQRYWGTPIPIIYCETHGAVPVPEEDLPVILPEDAQFKPTGESPLRDHEGFLNVPCPVCCAPSRRETDTLDTFVDSSWYQYRYVSPHDAGAPFDPDMAARWLPVDQYTGGIEHATMHLLYTRFFTKAMRDIGLVPYNEPFTRLFNQGIILGEDSEKMSKSRGNVIDPDDLVARLGTDTVRLFLMFLGPWDQGGPWNSRGISGIQRFLDRALTVVTEPAGSGPADEEAIRALRRATHQTIREVTKDIEGFQFNTMISELMEFVNHLMRVKDTAITGTPAWREAVETLTLLLAPIAPHTAEEFWHRLGREFSIHQQPWPAWDPALARDETVEIAVQVNGKVRGHISLPPDAAEPDALATAGAADKVAPYLEGKTIVKAIYVPGRLVSFSVR